MFNTQSIYPSNSLSCHSTINAGRVIRRFCYKDADRSWDNCLSWFPLHIFQSFCLLPGWFPDSLRGTFSSALRHFFNNRAEQPAPSPLNNPIVATQSTFLSFQRSGLALIKSFTMTGTFENWTGYAKIKNWFHLYSFILYCQFYRHWPISERPENKSLLKIGQWKNKEVHSFLRFFRGFLETTLIEWIKNSQKYWINCGFIFY